LAAAERIRLGILRRLRRGDGRLFGVLPVTAGSTSAAESLLGRGRSGMNTIPTGLRPAPYSETGAVEQELPAEMSAVDLNWQHDVGSDPELWLYRDRTMAMLKTYLRYSIEVGRLPSVLGRELFRARLTAYRMTKFEDAVIFVHDVERAIQRLATFTNSLSD
jgi:hypothetical protein